jgi:hypothetical protein
MPSKQPGSIFKRLETDTEFRDRVRTARGYAPELNGEYLDNYAWFYWKMQRRIIEAEA